jgi:hypothetical protein
MPPHHHMKKRRPGNCQPNTLPTCNTISIANQPGQYTVQTQHSYVIVCHAPCVCRVPTVTARIDMLYYVTKAARYKC